MVLGNGLSLGQTDKEHSYNAAYTNDKAKPLPCDDHPAYDAGYFEIALPVHEADVSTPDRDEHWKPAMATRKANSWSAGGNSKFWNFDKDFDDFQQERRELGQSSALTQSQVLNQDDHVIIIDDEIFDPSDEHYPASKVTAELDEEREGEEQRLVRHRLPKEAKLKRLLWRNLQTRALVAEKRLELTEYRLKISTADEGLMRLIRKKRTQQTSGADEDGLEEQLNLVQSARDSYGPLEESYNTLEDQLNREEYEVTQLENELSDNDLLSTTQERDSESVSGSSVDEDILIRDITENSPDTLYDRYMSRLGDADLLREEYADLVIDHTRLEEIRDLRRKVGKELLPQDQEILSGFSSKEVDILEELRKVEEDVERLKAAYLRGNTLKEYDNGEVDILNSVDTWEIPEYSGFPLLSDLQNSPENEEKSKSLLSDFKEKDTGDRITRWLLHKLRSSRMEVELLARLSADDGVNPLLDTSKWQEEVLEFWYLDSANLPPSAYEIQATATAPATSPFADKDNVSLFRADDAQLIQLFIRSPSSNHLQFDLLLRLTKTRGKSVMSV